MSTLAFFGTTLMTAAIVFFLGKVFVDIPIFQEYDFVPYFVGAFATVLFMLHIHLYGDGDVLIQVLSMIVFLTIGLIRLSDFLEED